MVADLARLHPIGSPPQRQDMEDMKLLRGRQARAR